MPRSRLLAARGMAVVLWAVVLACQDRGRLAPAPSAEPASVSLAAWPAFLRKGWPGAPVTLDLSQPEQRRFLSQQLAQTPFTAAATPQLHRVISAMGAPPEEARTLRQMSPPPENKPVDLLDVFGAVSADGAASATGIASAVGRSTFIHTVLRLVDAETAVPLGPPAYASSFTGVQAPVTASAKAARPGQKILAVMTAIYTPYACPEAAVDCHPRPGLSVLGEDGGTKVTSALTTHVSGAPYAQVFVQPLAAAAGTVISPASPPVPLAPLSTGDGGTTVCLGRLPGSSPVQCNPDGGPLCTYCDISQPMSQTPLLRLPVSGTVSLRNATTTPPTVTSFSSYIVPISGGACQAYNTTNTDGGFSSLSNGLVVRWSYGQTNYDTASWLQYGTLQSGSTCWTTTGEPINFQFQFTVQDTQGNLVPVTVADFGQPNASTTVVPAIQLAYGCLAAGTLVTMADGKAKPVEQVIVGDSVRSDASGTVRPVVSTYIGTEFLPLVRITTANNRSVTVTEGHPMLGPDSRITLAKRVKVGAVLLTATGPSAVTRVELLPPPPGQGVRVYNLDVGEAHGKPALTDTNRTLFAGDILVGDNAMQREHGLRVQLAAVEDGSLPVPPEWAAEYALARKLAASR